MIAFSSLSFVANVFLETNHFLGIDCMEEEGPLKKRRRVLASEKKESKTTPREGSYENNHDDEEAGEATSILLSLDPTLLQLILWHMPDLHTLLSFSTTCKTLHTIANDDESFWNPFFLASLKGETRMVFIIP